LFPEHTMRITLVLERVVRLVRDTTRPATQNQISRNQDGQRDESSMADFVRILQKHDNRVNG
jgi:hypothetical protein